MAGPVQQEHGKSPEKAGARRPPAWKDERFLGLFLILLVFLAYQPAWRGGFLWDDDDHLTTNPCIVGPLGFREIWLSSSAVYYPLVLSSFWVLHAIWRLDPLPYHLVNLGMHAACGLLLWRVLRYLKVPGAWLGAALWALHPVQVESAAWITELKNTQSGVFYLLAILFFLQWRERLPPVRKGNEWHYALALFCALLAILSKSSTVMLPVVLGLCEWWLDGRWSWRNGRRLIPFLLISAAAGAWTIWEQKYRSGAIGPEWAQSGPERFVMAGKAVWFYLDKLAWPHPLIFIYPRWEIDASRWSAYLPVATLGAVSLVLWGNRRRMGALFFAFSYFVVSLFPVIGFFNVYFFRYSLVGDHFQYLASMGPAALAGAAIARGGDWIPKNGWLWRPAFCGALLAVLGALTWSQSGMYRDVESLYRTTIQRNPACWLMHNNLGVLLTNGRLEEAIAHFQEALRIKPDYSVCENNLGTAFLKQGAVGEAIAHYRKALEITPDAAGVQNNLAWVLATTSQAPWRNGNVAVEMARRASRSAGERNPSFLDTLAAAYAEAGQLDDARATAKRSLELARAAGQRGLEEQLDVRLKLYEAGLPYHEER